MVTPVTAVALAESVITVEEGELDGLNVAVTPLGSPVAVKVTGPVKPPVETTEIVDVVLNL